MPLYFSRMKDRLFYGWVVLISGLIIGTIVLGTRHSFGVFFKFLESDFGLSRGVTSGVFSMYMALCGLFAILGGWAFDRYGPRVVILITSLITGLSLLLTSLTSTSWQLFISYSLLLAVGTGGTPSSV